MGFTSEISLFLEESCRFNTFDLTLTADLRFLLLCSRSVAHTIHSSFFSRIFLVVLKVIYH